MSIIAKLKAWTGGAPAASQLVIDGRSMPVKFRRHPRARRFILRLDEAGEGILITLPWRASVERGLDFAASQAAWIWSERQRRAAPVPVRLGARIPLRGVSHEIAHRPEGRNNVWVEPGEPPLLCVSGAVEHAPRRIVDWLKRQARADLASASRLYAERMGASFSRLTLRDTASRWGSCSAKGALSYSWRLILAPPFVLDYVAAHEAAHLIEMNHSKSFWALVERHCPRASEARRWLKTSGRTLHLYGARTSVCD